MKRLLLLLAVALMLCAQTAPTNIPQITGDGSTHQLLTSGLARAVQFVTPAGNAATVLIGDSTTSATSGIPLVAGAADYWPPWPDNKSVLGKDSYHDLSKIYYFAAVGDKLNVVYWK